jgi:NADH dehydrogenase
MNVVTGAFGYTGKYIARRLLERDETVTTLTGNPALANEFGPAIRAVPFRFDDPAAMAESIRGTRVLYNTYWVRFDRRDTTHERAVKNTIALIRAAQMAGVERIVHIGITNPSADSGLPYFRGKALLEEEIQRSKIGYAIVRPTVIFGKEDILINNIANLLRRLPVFMVPGSGEYRLQPVFVEDVARIAVEAGGASGNLTVDAVGPETFRFDELVRLIAATVGSRARLMKSPPWLALLAARALGVALSDVVLTRDEVEGLMAGLLVSDRPPTGQTRLSDWLEANRATLGQRYANEIRRHYGAKSRQNPTVK